MGGWVVMTLGFGFYLSEIASYNSIFGSLATVVVLIAYLYAAAVVFLGGVQVDALVRERAQPASSRAPSQATSSSLARPRRGGDEHDVVDAQRARAPSSAPRTPPAARPGASRVLSVFSTVAIAADVLAAAGEDGELVAHRRAAVGDVEQVARVGVAGDERAASGARPCRRSGSAGAAG